MFGKKGANALLGESDRSLIGETMQIEGDMTSTGAVDVAGLITGNIHCNEMLVLDSGSIKGTLSIKKIEINGHVEGKVIADYIILGSKAVIKGDILFKNSLKTEEGAEIEGYISKVRKSTQDEEDNDIEAIGTKPAIGKPTLVKSDKKEVV